jgi:hypothetical protein
MRHGKEGTGKKKKKQDMARKAQEITSTGLWLLFKLEIRRKIATAPSHFPIPRPCYLPPFTGHGGLAVSMVRIAALFWAAIASATAGPWSQPKSPLPAFPLGSTAAGCVL